VKAIWLGLGLGVRVEGKSTSNPNLNPKPNSDVVSLTITLALTLTLTLGQWKGWTYCEGYRRDVTSGAEYHQRLIKLSLGLGLELGSS
jgi:hypothetical protein